MPCEVSIYPEPYAPSGNIGDGGLRKLLGAPSLNSLQMVIRESVQNSCDAAKLGIGPTVLIRIRTLSPAQISILRDTVFLELPDNGESKKKLLSFLASDKPRVLEICDYLTLGLAGPTRADCIPANTKDTNFIDFMRNFGSSHDTQNRGGTYGFGKASLYQASQCQTIIVDSSTSYDSKKVRRLMGCHLGLQHEKTMSSGQVQRFTGRHWWGQKKTDDFVDPIEGDEATQLSFELGFPRRQENETGTSIMVLDPFAEYPTDILAGVIQECLLWNFWPRLTLDTPKDKRITFQIQIENIHYNLPLPEKFPPLDLYALALKKIRDGAKSIITINSQKPAKKLGTLALVKGLRAVRVPLTSKEHSIFPDTSAHVALMRPVELVVKYHEGAFLPDERVEWAGVFIADEEVQKAFAKAEPPAHDDWQPKIIDDAKEKSYVTVALKRIKDEANQFSSPLLTVDQQGASVNSLAAAAGAIGQILTSLDGQGGSPKRTSTTTPTTRKLMRNSISHPVFIKLESKGAKIYAFFEVDVKLLPYTKPMIIRATPMLAADGSAFSEETLLTAQPKISTITNKENIQLGTKSDRLIIGATDGTYEIVVQIPKGYATTIKVDLLEVELI